MSNKNIETNKTLIGLKSVLTAVEQMLILLLTAFYLVSRYLRVILLQSGLGFVSQCKHSPSCGENLVIQIKNNGFRQGSLIAFEQLAKCY